MKGTYSNRTHDFWLYDIQINEENQSKLLQKLLDIKFERQKKTKLKLCSFSCVTFGVKNKWGSSLTTEKHSWKKNVLVKLNITLTQWCVKPEKVVPGLFITDFYHGFYSSIGKIFLETVVNS